MEYRTMTSRTLSALAFTAMLATGPAMAQFIPYQQPSFTPYLGSPPGSSWLQSAPPVYRAPPPIPVPAPAPYQPVIIAPTGNGQFLLRPY
jgi:hypothetical protein